MFNYFITDIFFFVHQFSLLIIKGKSMEFFYLTGVNYKKRKLPKMIHQDLYCHLLTDIFPKKNFTCKLVFLQAKNKCGEKKILVVADCHRF